MWGRQSVDDDGFLLNTLSFLFLPESASSQRDKGQLSEWEEEARKMED